MDNNLPPIGAPHPAEAPGSAPPPVSPPPAAPPPFVPPPAPPVISVASAPKPPRRNGWRTFAILLLVLVAFLVFINLRHIVNSVGGRHVEQAYGPRLEEVTVRDNNSSDKIAIIPVNGVISGDATDSSGFSIVSLIKAELKQADRDPDVKGVILKIDSPGGEVLAADEIARAITNFQDRPGGKPVIVSMGSLAASGGYYISAPCDWIVANELTITGSIGVIMEGLNYHDLLDKVGVHPMVFKSGRYKDMLSSVKGTNEITADEREMVQKLIDETFAKFKKVVQDGREAAYRNMNHNEEKVSHQLSNNWADYADGRILSGTTAKDLGFVDEVGDFDAAVKRAQRIAGTGKANLVEYRPVFELSSLLRLLGQSDAKSVKLDLGVEMPKLRPGCQYFILPTYLHL